MWGFLLNACGMFLFHAKVLRRKETAVRAINGALLFSNCKLQAFLWFLLCLCVELLFNAAGISISLRDKSPSRFVIFHITKNKTYCLFCILN